MSNKAFSSKTFVLFVSFVSFVVLQTGCVLAVGQLSGNRLGQALS